MSVFLGVAKLKQLPPDGNPMDDDQSFRFWPSAATQAAIDDSCEPLKYHLTKGPHEPFSSHG
jgi:hypothetical protein